MAALVLAIASRGYNPENINKPDTILIIYGATSQVDQPLSTSAVSEKSNVWSM